MGKLGKPHSLELNMVPAILRNSRYLHFPKGPTKGREERDLSWTPQVETPCWRGNALHSSGHISDAAFSAGHSCVAAAHSRL